MPLEFPLDQNSKRIIEKTVDGFLKDKMMDVMWRDYFYITSLLGEVATRYAVSGAGTVSVTEYGLTLETTADANSTARAQLRMTNVINVMRFNKETRFRVVFEKDNITNSELTILTLHDDGGSGNYIGFKIDDATITGLSKDGTTEVTVGLGTYTADQKITLEFRYLPNQRINFYVKDQNGTDLYSKGVITSNFPKQNTGDKFMLDVLMKTTTTTQFTGKIHNWEFIQKR